MVGYSWDGTELQGGFLKPLLAVETKLTESDTANLRGGGIFFWDDYAKIDRQ